MKIYQLDSPYKLREAISLMKDEGAARSAGNLATVWSVATRQGKPNAFTVYIKLGRSASLCRAREGREIVLGDMRLKSAREFVLGLNEHTGGIEK